MKITTNELFPVESLINSHKNDKMPIKLSYKMYNFSKEISEKLDFFREQYRTLIDDCATKDDQGNPQFDSNGNPVVVIEKIPEYNEKFKEMMNCEVEIKDTIFTLDELDPFQFSIAEVATLEKFIKE